MATAKNRKKTGSKTKKGKELTQFKKGQSGNPKGRPLGARDRRTVIMEALKRIAEKKNMNPEEVEEALQVSGIEKALKGSFPHYDAISNGLYGKMSDKMDITSGGKTLADLITLANGNKRKGARNTTGKVQE